MNIAKIRPLIKETKHIYIVRDAARKQWIGTGTAFYVADEAIDFDKNNVLSIFDIEADKRSEYLVEEMDMNASGWLDTMPQTKTDRTLYPMFSVDYVGELMTFMITDDGEGVLIRQKEIAPNNGKGGQMFVLRKAGALNVVACMNDLFCGAIITPQSRKVFDDIVKWCSALTGSRYAVKG